MLLMRPIGCCAFTHTHGLIVILCSNAIMLLSEKKILWICQINIGTVLVCMYVCMCVSIKLLANTDSFLCRGEVGKAWSAASKLHVKELESGSYRYLHINDTNFYKLFFCT
jgi:hypothetical protein